MYLGDTIEGNCYDMPVTIETSGGSICLESCLLPEGKHTYAKLFSTGCVHVCVFGMLKHGRASRVLFVCQFGRQGPKENNSTHQLNDDKTPSERQRVFVGGCLCVY